MTVLIEFPDAGLMLECEERDFVRVNGEPRMMAGVIQRPVIPGPDNRDDCGRIYHQALGIVLEGLRSGRIQKRQVCCERLAELESLLKGTID